MRANERTAAFVALYTLKAGLPVVETIDAFSTIDPPGCSHGSAFCTVTAAPSGSRQIACQTNSCAAMTQKVDFLPQTSSAICLATPS